MIQCIGHIVLLGVTHQEIWKLLENVLKILNGVKWEDLFV